MTNKDEEMLLPRQKFNHLKGNVNGHCDFLTVTQFKVSFSCFFVFFRSSMPSTRVKQKNNDNNNSNNDDQCK